MTSAFQRALEHRRSAKKKKRVFVVRGSFYTKRVKRRWRFPRGRHSGVRQEHKGKPALPTPGYGSHRLVRGLHSSGLRKVRVHTINDLLALNPSTEGAVIASTLGARKKLLLLEQANRNNIPVLNIRDITKGIDQLTSLFVTRKKEKAERRKQKNKKEEEKKTKAEQKKKEKKAELPSSPAEEQKVPSETDHEKERELMEKTITKRQ